MARRNNPDTTTLAILAGGAALVFLLGRKKTAAPSSQPPPPNETVVAVEQPVSIVAQGQIAVAQPPVVSIPESTPAIANTGTVSVSSGGQPATLFVDGQRTNYTVLSAPAATQVKLPVGTVTLLLQYADGTQSVGRAVVVEQGLTKEVVIMPPIAAGSTGNTGNTGNTGSTGNNQRGKVQVRTQDAGQLVIDGRISSITTPAAPAVREFNYTPQNITLQIQYLDGALSDKYPITVITGQTVGVTIPPRLYSNTPQGLINLNPQSLSAFNPSLVAGRLSAIGTAVNNKTDSGTNAGSGTNTSTGTLSVTSNADGTLVYGGRSSLIKANSPFTVSLTPQTLNMSVLYSGGGNSAPQTVTIVAGQTKTVTFTRGGTPVTAGAQQPYSALSSGSRPSFLQQRISGLALASK